MSVLDVSTVVLICQCCIKIERRTHINPTAGGMLYQDYNMMVLCSTGLNLSRCYLELHYLHKQPSLLDQETHGWASCPRPMSRILVYIPSANDFTLMLYFQCSVVCNDGSPILSIKVQDTCCCIDEHIISWIRIISAEKHSYINTTT